MLEIVTVAALPQGMLNAYLLIQNREVVLVDTGLPNTTAKIGKALRARHLDWAAIRAIVLTHGHIDHAGAASEIARLSGAPIHAHRGDLPYLTGTAPLMRPTGPFGHLFKQTGLIERPYPKVCVDNVLDSAGPTPLGLWPDAPLTLLPTPGHTPGSISVLLGDGRVMAGDLLASGILLGGIAFRAHTKQPPFEENTAAVVLSLRLLLESGSNRFYLGHGGPVSREQVERHIGRLERRLA